MFCQLITVSLGISDGESFSRNLNALIASDFVVKYVPFGMTKRQVHYKLVDPFCMFYLHFLDGRMKVGPHFWQQGTMSQPVVSWRGFAFENVCFAHVEQIKGALGISGVITESSAWSKRGDDGEGSQIDLLISRKDNVINMCEIKFYEDGFAVVRDYYRVLLGRQALLASEVSPRITVHSTLITTFGLVHNKYSGAFANVITLDGLFA